MLAPTIFFLGLNGVFGALTQLTGFTPAATRPSSIPVSMLQGAGFTGAAAGVNLARDIEAGLARPPAGLPRPALGAARRHGARRRRPGADPGDLRASAIALAARRRLARASTGSLIAYLMVVPMAAVAACWGSMLALRFRSQSAAPLMQAGMLALVLTTTAYAPLALLQRLAAGRRPTSTR